MTTLRHDVPTRCTPDALWRVLAELDGVHTYNPTVRASRVLGDQREGVGACRECDLVPSGQVTERVTTWEPGRAVGLEVIRSDWPVHFMRWTTRIEDRPGGAAIVQDLEYRVKYGVVGWLLDRLVMRRKLRTTLDGVLAGLARRAEGQSS